MGILLPTEAKAETELRLAAELFHVFDFDELGLQIMGNRVDHTLVGLAGHRVVETADDQPGLLLLCMEV